MPKYEVTRWYVVGVTVAVDAESAEAAERATAPDEAGAGHTQHEAALADAINEAVAVGHDIMIDWEAETYPTIVEIAEEAASV
jgi:hypothetical protein